MTMKKRAADPRGIALCFIAAGLLALAACAPVAERGEDTLRRTLIAFPGPPDEPRFYYERTIRSDADVVAEKEQDSLIRRLTGEARGAVGMAKPYGVAARRGRLYVTDPAASTVHVFDIPQRRYFRLGEDGEAFLAKPIGIDVDAEGNVYVADTSLKIVRVYNRDGRHLRDVGVKGDFDRPTGVAVDPAGERLLVVDIGGIDSANHRVRVFDAAAGRHLFDIGSRGSGDGQFNLPRDVAVGKDRRIYVVDGGNFRVSVFDWDGNYQKSWGKAGRSVGDFARPKELATDSEGRVYVVDAAFGNFQIFTPEGETLLFIGNRGDADTPATYILPSGIAVDEDGRIFLVDQWFSKVDVFRPAELPADRGFFSARPASPPPPAK
jgi:DNA-binding beta-propeller fold protein YncE